jgi:hypothetical protein
MRKAGKEELGLNLETMNPGLKNQLPVWFGLPAFLR